MYTNRVLSREPEGAEEELPDETTVEHPADDLVELPLEGRVSLQSHGDVEGGEALLQHQHLASLPRQPFLLYTYMRYFHDSIS